jgi:hypothetical protein
MIFPVRRFPLSRPDPVHPDRRYRLRPVIPLLVIGPGGRVVCSPTVDTGAVAILLPRVDADRIGITSFVSSGELFGVGTRRSAPLTVDYAEVLLRVWQGGETCQWKAVIGFTEARMSSDGLFGISGGLEYFHTTLDVFANQICLIPRVSLPVAEGL